MESAFSGLGRYAYCSCTRWYLAPLRPGHTKHGRGARGWGRIGMILVQRQLRMYVRCKNHVSRGKFFLLYVIFLSHLKKQISCTKWDELLHVRYQSYILHRRAYSVRPCIGYVGLSHGSSAAIPPRLRGHITSPQASQYHITYSVRRKQKNRRISITNDAMLFAS